MWLGRTREQRRGARHREGQRHWRAVAELKRRGCAAELRDRRHRAHQLLERGRPLRVLLLALLVLLGVRRGLRLVYHVPAVLARTKPARRRLERRARLLMRLALDRLELGAHTRAQEEHGAPHRPLVVGHAEGGHQVDARLPRNRRVPGGRLVALRVEQLMHELLLVGGVVLLRFALHLDALAVVLEGGRVEDAHHLREEQMVGVAASREAHRGQHGVGSQLAHDLWLVPLLGLELVVGLDAADEADVAVAQVDSEVVERGAELGDDALRRALARALRLPLCRRREERLDVRQLALAQQHEHILRAAVLILLQEAISVVHDLARIVLDREAERRLGRPSQARVRVARRVEDLLEHLGVRPLGQVALLLEQHQKPLGHAGCLGAARLEQLAARGVVDVPQIEREVWHAVISVPPLLLKDDHAVE